jgi:hypothetical protein
VNQILAQGKRRQTVGGNLKVGNHLEMVHARLRGRIRLCVTSECEADGVVVQDSMLEETGIEIDFQVLGSFTPEIAVQVPVIPSRLAKEDLGLIEGRVTLFD